MQQPNINAEKVNGNICLCSMKNTDSDNQLNKHKITESSMALGYSTGHDITLMIMCSGI